MATYEFKIQSNRYLKENCVGYYSMDFKSVSQGGELTFLHTLKNNKLDKKEADLIEAKNEARETITEFLFDYLYNYNFNNIVVCRIPRSKSYFKESQLYFQQAIREAISAVNNYVNINLVDGIDYIWRIKDVATTHLANSPLAQATLPKLCSGDKPYPGITKDTCSISDKVRGRTILLIDDIYTWGVGVVEDCIQALYDKGAEKVIFYAVGRTVKNSNSQATKIEV